MCKGDFKKWSIKNNLVFFGLFKKRGLAVLDFALDSLLFLLCPVFGSLRLFLLLRIHSTSECTSWSSSTLSWLDPRSSLGLLAHPALGPSSTLSIWRHPLALVILQEFFEKVIIIFLLISSTFLIFLHQHENVFITKVASKHIRLWIIVIVVVQFRAATSFLNRLLKCLFAGDRW